VLAGARLIAFEAAEFGWIGFQPLEAVFAPVGLAIIGLALSAADTQSGHRPVICGRAETAQMPAAPMAEPMP